MANETDIERLKSLNIPKECEMYGTIQRAIKALEIVDEFENTRMIIGGRLQGNSMAYKKGLEDGKCKALEQELKTDNDCISRRAVLNLPRINIRNKWGNIIKGSVDIEDIRQLPSVNPQEPNVGHWQKYKSMIYCSECGASIEAGYLNDMKYCYNCGAKTQGI